MPVVTVYLRAADERSLKEEGHDPPEWVRDAVKRALSERGVTAGGGTGSEPVSREGSTPSSPTPRSESASHFKPDPKPEKKKR